MIYVYYRPFNDLKKLSKILFCVIMFFNGHADPIRKEIYTWAEELITFNLVFMKKVELRSNRDIFIDCWKFLWNY